MRRDFTVDEADVVFEYVRVHAQGDDPLTISLRHTGEIDAQTASTRARPGQSGIQAVA
jgi:hypothetical protein